MKTSQRALATCRTGIETCPFFEIPAYDVANGERVVRSPVASKCPESPIPLSWKDPVSSHLGEIRLLAFLLPKFLNLYCHLLHWWIFTFWNALGFILDLPLFLCIHIRWHHLDPRLKINLYGNGSRLMSLDPPLDSRYILHILSWLSKKKPTPQQFPPHNKLVVSSTTQTPNLEVLLHSLLITSTFNSPATPTRTSFQMYPFLSPCLLPLFLSMVHFLHN